MRWGGGSGGRVKRVDKRRKQVYEGNGWVCPRGLGDGWEDADRKGKNA